MVKKVETKNEIEIVKPLIKKIIVEEAAPNYGISEEMDFNDVYDDCDIASALEMNYIAQALSKHKGKVAPEKHPDFDGVSCLDCGNEIPKERLELKRIRCFDCQNALEIKNKLFGKR